MGLDPTILLQSQPVQLQSPVDAMSKVMTLKNMARQGQAQDRELADQQALRDAYKGNMTVGPDGTPTLNRQGFMSQLGQQNPMLAMQKGQELQAQDVGMKEKSLGLLKQQTEAAHELTMSIAPDGSNWDQVRQQALTLGLPGAQNAPQQFPGPDVVQHMQVATMEMKDRVAAADRQRSFQEKQTEFGLKREDLSLRKDKQSSDKQNTSMQQAIQTLESARGNPAASQAEKDLYAAQKLTSLINLHGDPNKLSPEEVQLAASEVAKIATGGVPTSHELQGIIPSTVPSGLARLAEKVMNNPTGAQAGEFLKRYQAYGESLSKDAKKVIQDKYGRVIESKRDSLGEKNYTTLKDQYLNRFTSDSSVDNQDHATGAAAELAKRGIK